MKTTLNLFIVSFAALLLSACSKDMKYSCSPEATAWVERNLNEIKQMDRTQFSAIPYDEYQRAAFRVFSPQQKMQVWLGKITETLNLGWNAAERTHIIRLQEIITEHGNWFEPTTTKVQTEEVDDAISLTMFEWAEYAYETLHWTREQVYALVGTPNTVQSTDGKVLRKLRLGELEDPKTPEKPGPDWGNLTCECNLDHDFCWSGNCTAKGCGDPGTGGCGWVWAQKCNGLCM